MSSWLWFDLHVQRQYGTFIRNRRVNKRKSSTVFSCLKTVPFDDLQNIPFGNKFHNIATPGFCYTKWQANNEQDRQKANYRPTYQTQLKLIHGLKFDLMRLFSVLELNVRPTATVRLVEAVSPDREGSRRRSRTAKPLSAFATLLCPSLEVMRGFWCALFRFVACQRPEDSLSFKKSPRSLSL